MERGRIQRLPNFFSTPYYLTPSSATFVVCPTVRQHTRLWSLPWIPGPEKHHTTIGIAPLVDHGPHGWVRSCGTPDSLLLTHRLLLMTSQHGGRYDPQPVTRSSEWVSIISGTDKAADFKFGGYVYRAYPNKSPLKILEKKERERIQGLPNFLGTPYYLGNG